MRWSFRNLGDTNFSPKPGQISAMDRIKICKEIVGYLIKGGFGEWR